MSQKQKSPCFVPLVNSEAGACLSFANWQEVGINAVGYTLDALLMRPGLSFLQGLESLRAYCNWQGKLVLNASLAEANQQEIYKARSHYDGTLICLKSDELVSLILTLKPELVVLPIGLSKQIQELKHRLPENMQIFVPAVELAELGADSRTGCYLAYEDGKASFVDFLNQVKEQKSPNLYLAGAFSLAQLRELSELGVSYIESNKPAADALMGIVYTEQGNLALLAEEMAYQQKLIESTCTCPTCAQGFTRAYLHHLLRQTPLLCQRFLIQHNIANYKLATIL